MHKHSAEMMQSHRKDEHFFLAEKFHHAQTNDFDEIRFIHQSLPESALAAIDLQPDIFNWQWPFYINAMTGGSPQTKKLNAALARIAAATDLPMAVGSQSIAIKYPELQDTFQVVRQYNPHGFVIGNIGAGNDWQAAQQAITMLNADALQIHVNVAQEIVMPEGDQCFYWQDNIRQIVQKSPIPIIVKEVGFGMSKQTIEQLIALGVSYIDVAGRGGTNFIQIENERRSQKEYAFLNNWGQSTVESLLESQPCQTQTHILASGGVRNALDIIKCLRLGAHAVGIAGTILHSLLKNGEAQTISLIQQWQDQLRHLLALLGAHNLNELRHKDIIISEKLLNYLQQRHLPMP
ncbi:MAG: type 2 isopentenyl-diphosphate Delta-isomerase [Candidatus Paralactobacillus gallistercoris]|uniref:Isopentenyl-diphosphate delta-isomerase n=1 Tax=Candidatus Paralactobacillus gallistercoris TaxID=2838724 RepID=A0A948TJ82_9LACO|nr:type 2 isopentenyl-diphosphate Delta-isomerase [Candidatus Paralactobacillus gallistercoris]